MTPEEKKLLNDVILKLNALADVYYRTNFIDKQVYQQRSFFNNDVYFNKKMAFFGATTPVDKQTSITPPTGGAVIDAEARTAINDIISKLQNLNLTS